MSAEKWINSYCGYALRQDLAEKDVFTYEDMKRSFEAGKVKPDEMDLDKRMAEAGMTPVSEMLERSILGDFQANASVKDLESFEEWIQMRREEFLKMQAKMILDGEKKDDLYEWVVAHNAVLGEVIANFRKATGRKP